MKNAYIETDFWTKEKFQFSEFYFVDFKGNDTSIRYKADLSIPGDLSRLFKAAADFNKTKKARKDYHSDNEWSQFAVMYDGRLTPVKWFTIVKGADRYDHDVCSSIVLIRKNNLTMPFGFRNKRNSRYKELGIACQAYKYLGNRV